MAENKKRDPFQYDFDKEWDVERELYGDLLADKAPTRPKGPKDDQIDVILPLIKPRSEVDPPQSPRPWESQPKTPRGDKPSPQEPRQRQDNPQRQEPRQRQDNPQRQEPRQRQDNPQRQEPRQRQETTQRRTSGLPADSRQRGGRYASSAARASAAKKKGKPNYKGWAILGVMALTAILILFLLIKFFVWALSPGEKGGEDIPQDSSTTEITTTVPTTTVDYEAMAAEILETAELQAAMYDYDAAIETIKSYGSGWTLRPELTQADRKYQEAKAQLVRWEDTTLIPHVFFHSLIVDTNRAFDGGYSTDGYNQYMTTIYEFNRMLEELYARDYVLVRIHDIAKLTTDENGKEVYRQGDIYLPPGKKPIIMSQDDLNYYEYMIDSDEDHIPDAGGDGFASKLVVDDAGNITCEYITAEGETVFGDYDMVPLLEKFVREHPDFSYRGAKAIVGMTGYEGVYGYRTDIDGKERLSPEAFEKEVEEAKKVTQWLRENGWELASHSYGHPAYGTMSTDGLKKDVARWEEEVQPIVGDTDIILYPHGSDIAGVGKYSGEKYEAMYAAGYRFFCNVDSSDYWVQIRDDYVRQGRRNLDGYRMWYGPHLLDDLFNTDDVFDPARPTPVPPI